MEYISRVLMKNRINPDEEDDFDFELINMKTFIEIRNRHYELIDGLNILLIDPKVRDHIEFPLQIASLKRSGGFIILHSAENYDKYGRRLEDVNDDLLVLTSYIVRHLFDNES